MEKHAKGFAGSLAFGQRAAVISIDLMRSYFEEESPFCLPSTDCLHSAARVIASARKCGIPVIHTKVVLGPEGVDAGVFITKIPALKMLIGENRMNEFMPEVAPLDDELVVVKQYASAFFGTSLSSTLRGLGVDTVVILGVSTSGCVRATGLDSLQHGFIPMVVRDAVGDRGPAPHDQNLFDLQAKYAEVISEQDAIMNFEKLASAKN
jgi:nicotinamidase-related amidase